MTPRYEWTPASEPPDTGRRVLTWIIYPNNDTYLDAGRYSALVKSWSHSSYVTHWRDIEPPKESAE